VDTWTGLKIIKIKNKIKRKERKSPSRDFSFEKLKKIKKIKGLIIN